MVYLMGFVDYDGTYVYFTANGQTEDPDKATHFDSVLKAQAALSFVQLRKRFTVFKFEDGKVLPWEIE